MPIRIADIRYRLRPSILWNVLQLKDAIGRFQNALFTQGLSILILGLIIFIGPVNERP